LKGLELPSRFEHDCGWYYLIWMFQGRKQIRINKLLANFGYYFFPFCDFFLKKIILSQIPFFVIKSRQKVRKN